MNGCIYRTKDGECELWEKDRNHSPFCRPDCDHQHPSNGDRIRSMTDEELAGWIVKHDAYKNGCYSGECGEKDCAQCWLEWLMKEAAE